MRDAFHERRIEAGSEPEGHRINRAKAVNHIRPEKYRDMQPALFYGSLLESGLSWDAPTTFSIEPSLPEAASCIGSSL